MTAQGVDQLFDFSEDKQGFFWARLKPKKFLEKPEFKTMCVLARDLGGEDYLQGAKAWKIPGPLAKRVDTTSILGPAGDARSKPSEGPRPEARKEPSGVAPKVLTEDKSRPPQFTVPLKALLSMPFQCRTNPDDPEMAELTESIKALGVLQPILVRPKPNGLYEIVYGQRRARAAEKAGLVEVPVTIRFLSDEEAFTLQLTENLQRKDLSEEEKTRALGELAKRTGWNAQQIADKLKMSYTWVVKYLPEEFKDREMAELGKRGGEAKAENEEVVTESEIKEPATRRVAEEPEEPEPSTGYPPIPSESTIGTPSKEEPTESKPQIVKRAFDVWGIAAMDTEKPFGDKDYPGNIPGDIVGNVLIWFLPDGGKVVDPMAGGGVTEDVCKFLGIEKYPSVLFDSKRLHSYRYRETIKYADVSDGKLPDEANNAALVFADPPYGPLKEYGMTINDLYRVLSGLAKASYGCLKGKGIVAVLMQNYYAEGECQGEFIPLVRRTIEIFEATGFKQIFEITVPLYGKVARSKISMTHIDRRLVIFTKVENCAST
jgi:ParB family chromosome partitioning protein